MKKEHIFVEVSEDELKLLNDDEQEAVKHLKKVFNLYPHNLKPFKEYVDEEKKSHTYYYDFISNGVRYTFSETFPLVFKDEGEFK